MLTPKILAGSTVGCEKMKDGESRSHVCGVKLSGTAKLQPTRLGLARATICRAYSRRFVAAGRAVGVDATIRRGVL